MDVVLHPSRTPAATPTITPTTPTECLKLSSEPNMSTTLSNLSILSIFFRFLRFHRYMSVLILDLAA